MSPSVERDVSVVIPAHDAVGFLADAIASVLGQTQPPLELLVVDDGSTDGTADLAEGHAGVRCIRLGQNQGQAAALNRGISEARGAYVAFLDADDVWRPQKLEWQRAAFDADPLLDAVYGHAIERVEARTDVGRSRDGRVLPAHLPSALLARRAALQRVGGFDERWRIGSVVDWYSRALEAGLRIAVVPEIVYERRIHGGNLGLAQKDDRGQYLAVVHAALKRRRGEQQSR